MNLKACAIAAGAMISLLAGNATAADLDRPPPARAPVYIDDGSQPALRWAGLYAGLSAGYGWGTSDYYLAQAGHGAAQNEPSGFLGAVSLGYNWQTVSGLVYGLEGDIGYMDLTDQRHWRDEHLFKSTFGPFWATARGRLGYSMGRILPYVTAGVAVMETDETMLGAGEGMANPGQTSPNEDFHWGWVAGAGIEMAISERTSLKVEYLHMDFGQYKALNGNADTYTFEDKIDIARVGINVRF